MERNQPESFHRSKEIRLSRRTKFRGEVNTRLDEIASYTPVQVQHAATSFTFRFQLPLLQPVETEAPNLSSKHMCSVSRVQI